MSKHGMLLASMFRNFHDVAGVSGLYNLPRSRPQYDDGDNEKETSNDFNIESSKICYILLTTPLLIAKENEEKLH